MLLARDWRGQSLLGWQASEKLNGCRVEWDGEVFWTRHGNCVEAPRWFTKGLPRCRINGEIHAGRGVGFGNNNSAFKMASNAVRLGGHWFDDTDGGQPLVFTAFYLPEADGSWARRQQLVAATVKGCCHAEAIRFHAVRDAAAEARRLLKLRRANAEGAMYLQPDGEGQCGRSGELLRMKFLQ